MVIYDGMRAPGLPGRPCITRTSKGLEVGRRQCAKETVYLEVECGHCRDMLGKERWVYETRVRELSVCRHCQERCSVEERRKNGDVGLEVPVVVVAKVEVRQRVDSFLPPPSKDVHEYLADRYVRKASAAYLISPTSNEIRKVHEDSYVRKMSVAFLKPPTNRDVRKIRSDTHLRRPSVAYPPVRIRRFRSHEFLT